MAMSKPPKVAPPPPPPPSRESAAEALEKQRQQGKRDRSLSGRISTVANTLLGSGAPDATTASKKLLGG